MKHWGDEIDDLQSGVDDLTSRVAILEAFSNQLKQQMEAGNMVKSIIDISSGYKIKFTGGKAVEVSSIAGETSEEVAMAEIDEDDYQYISGEKIEMKSMR